MKSFSDYLIKPEENNDVIKNDLKEIKQSGLPVVVLGMGKCAFEGTIHKYRGG